MKSCNECKWCLMDDYGYSNYTTEGTNVYCLKTANPNGVFDRWYGEDERLNYAEQCELFVAGGCVQIDCDRENSSLVKIEAGEEKLSDGYGVSGDIELNTLIDTWYDKECS